MEQIKNEETKKIDIDRIREEWENLKDQYDKEWEKVAGPMLGILK